MHTCIWRSFCKNKFWNFLVFSPIFFWNLLEQLIRRPISKTAWKFVQCVVFYATFKIKNMVFSKLWAGISHAKAAMESKYFTVSVHSLGTTSMQNFKKIGHWQVVSLSSSVVVAMHTVCMPASHHFMVILIFMLCISPFKILLDSWRNLMVVLLLNQIKLMFYCF